MCDLYEPCECLLPKWKKSKRLSLLLLDCWQREYGRRPYKHFCFKILDFEDRMGRPFHSDRDGKIVVRFIKERPLCSVLLLGLTIFPRQEKLLYDFNEALCKLRRIELKLMHLPALFFQLLQANGERMHVQELNLEGTPLTFEDVEALRLFLLKAKSISYLNVYNCSVDHSKFAVLADGIHNSQTMRTINCGRLFGGHQLTLETTKIVHILASLVWQNKLVEISMSQCEFLAQDMEIIAEYMSNKNSKIMKLNLACNIIGADGTEYLMRAIAASSTLKSLDISGNALGTHGGMVIVKYLSSCYNLEQLNITYNDIDADTINRILTSMKKSIPLQQLKLYGNAFDECTANILRRLLDARVVPQDTIDITVTFDEILKFYRIVPYY